MQRVILDLGDVRMTAALELTGIRKAYYGQEILQDIELKLEAGRFYLLAGPNGVGKSTLMRILMRQERFDAGEGSVLGFPLSEDRAGQGSRVALVSEATDYALPLSLREIFARFPRIHPRWDASRFHELQGALGFDLSKRFSDLSRGQKMQVAMAAAFASRPELWLLDEVTSVLDARARELIVEKLRAEVDAGATVVLSTNIVTEVQHVADHLLVLRDGRLAIDSPLREVSKLFTRLRRAPKVDHPLFLLPACRAIGADSDGTRSYLIETREAGVIPGVFVDPEPVTAEEVFIYYTGVRS